MVAVRRAEASGVTFCIVSVVLLRVEAHIELWLLFPLILGIIHFLRVTDYLRGALTCKSLDQANLATFRLTGIVALIATSILASPPGYIRRLN